MPVLRNLAPLLGVRCPEEAVAYYRDKLGFQVGFFAQSEGLPAYAVLRRDGFEVHLIADDEHDTAREHNGFSARVDDVDGLYVEFQQRGAFAEGFPRVMDDIREHPPEDKTYGRRDIIFVDPEGYILVFGQPLTP